MKLKSCYGQPARCMQLDSRREAVQQAIGCTASPSLTVRDLIRPSFLGHKVRGSRAGLVFLGA